VSSNLTFAPPSLPGEKRKAPLLLRHSCNQVADRKN
jgi:hypothetical protein